jgi:hypothetical protein
MTSRAFSLGDRYELLALHRGLMEARFCEVANDPDVSGSPILSKIHRDIVQLLSELECGGSSASWKQWLTIEPDRREWRVAIKRASDASRWKELDEEGKKKLALDYLAPFEVRDDLLGLFIRTADQLRDQR